MTSFLDKLNLRPQERRLVVFVGLVVFVALNLLLVIPQFGKVEFWRNRQGGANQTLGKYKDEVGKIQEYKAKLKQLESEGVIIGSDDAILSLSKDVTALAGMSAVAVERYDPLQRGSSGRTNAFFEEAGLRISVTTGEKELVDFLWNLGSRNSLIRVRSMSLQPDSPNNATRLKGNIELVESFPKKTQTPTKTAGAVTPSYGPVTKKSAAAAAAGTNVARTTNAVAVKTAAPSTNWFKKLLARFTGSSKAAPKTNVSTKPKPAVPAPAKAPMKTNTPPRISSSPARK